MTPKLHRTNLTADSFQSSPNGIKKDDVKEDVLGFLSLVMSFAKAAKPMDEGRSVKYLVVNKSLGADPRICYETPTDHLLTFSQNIMPRTDFVGLYDQVKSRLPGSGSLYDLIKVLACYKNDGTYVLYSTLHHSEPR